MAALSDFMHFLRSSLPIILMPPAGLLWVVLLGLIVLKPWRRVGIGLIVFAFAGLYLLSLPAVCGALIAGLEATAPSAPGSVAGAPGAIVVLGGDGERTPDPLVAAEPGPLSMQRLAGAAQKARATGLPVLITGGSVGSEQPPVATLMATAFEHVFGLPVRWTETASENTCQNASLSAAILRRADIQSAYVVTHAWHMPRALLSFADAGYPVVAAPLRAEVNEDNGFYNYLPHTTAWLRSFYALHEWVGLIAYRLGACKPAPAATPGPAAPGPADGAGAG
jgi:uncharacterized SAM-binding protein YcdF (DUF218 family)